MVPGERRGFFVVIRGPAKTCFSKAQKQRRPVKTGIYSASEAIPCFIILFYRFFKNKLYTKKNTKKMLNAIRVLINSFLEK